MTQDKPAEPKAPVGTTLQPGPTTPHGRRSGRGPGQPAAVVAFISASLLIAILILNRFLFQPAKTMIGEMKPVAEVDTEISVNGHALKEAHTLANAFNAMNQQVRDIINRERQAAENMKGKVELIQDVVAMAAKGDLTGQIMVYGDQDVISQLATGIQKMPDSLNSLVTRIQQSGVQVTSSATQIAVATWDIEPMVSEMQSMVSTGVMGMEKFSDRYTAVLTTCARPARSWPTLSSR